MKTISPNEATEMSDEYIQQVQALPEFSTLKDFFKYAAQTYVLESLDLVKGLMEQAGHDVNDLESTPEDIDLRQQYVKGIINRLSEQDEFDLQEACDLFKKDMIEISVSLEAHMHPSQ